MKCNNYWEKIWNMLFWLTAEGGSSSLMINRDDTFS